MRLHKRFEWHADKAEKNLAKHRVSFDVASIVLADEHGDLFHVDEYDANHSAAEDRWITTASHPQDRRIILRIVWTEEIDETGELTRIISARTASKKERRDYAEQISGHENY